MTAATPPSKRKGREHLDLCSKAGPPQAKQAKQAWDPIRHFTHQVAVIRKLIPEPRTWDIFLGSLGTGIVGVRPRVQAPPMKRPAAKSVVRKRPASAVAAPAVSQGFVILFLNGKASKLQEWSGKQLAGFSPALDCAKRTLRWQCQRSDRHGRVIGKIREHVGAGGELVVVVRAAPGDEFKILGRAFDIQLEAEATFLVQDDDNLILEQGSQRIHRAILAQCIDEGLKAGIGLLPIKYPLRQSLKSPKYCAACCWTPATALIAFGELDAEAAGVLQTKPPALRGAKRKYRGIARMRTSLTQRAKRSAAAARRKLHCIPPKRTSFAASTYRKRWRRSVLQKASNQVVAKRIGGTENVDSSASPGHDVRKKRVRVDLLSEGAAATPN